jgi:hypothetical protein
MAGGDDAGQQGQVLVEMAGRDDADQRLDVTGRRFDVPVGRGACRRGASGRGVRWTVDAAGSRLIAFAEPACLSHGGQPCRWTAAARGSSGQLWTIRV